MTEGAIRGRELSEGCSLEAEECQDCRQQQMQDRGRERVLSQRPEMEPALQTP